MEPQNQNVTPQPVVPSPAPMPSTDKSTGMAVIAYLGILVIIPLIAGKDNAFVKFHAKQGLVLLIAWIVSNALNFLPFIGGMISMFIWLALMILMILGIINAVSGKEAQLPVIGQFADKFNF